MTQPFLITGLPRSRTAWFSAVANMMPGTICHHEPIQHVPAWRDCLTLWRRGFHRFTGIADCSMGLHLPELFAEFDVPTVIVQRPVSEVVRSLAAQGIEAPHFCRVLQARLIKSFRHPLVMTIGFDELHNRNKVVECLEWLLPGAEIDRDKVAGMMAMNVQVDMAKIRQAVTGQEDRRALLGTDVIAEMEIF